MQCCEEKHEDMVCLWMQPFIPYSRNGIIWDPFAVIQSIPYVITFVPLCSRCEHGRAFRYYWVTYAQKEKKEQKTQITSIIDSNIQWTPTEAIKERICWCSWGNRQISSTEEATWNGIRWTSSGNSKANRWGTWYIYIISSDSQLGGLRTYQDASIQGHTQRAQHHDTSKWVISMLKQHNAHPKQVHHSSMID